MDVTETRYRVGQRLRHPQFGEGLVVEVHTDRGREVLEVVFEGQLRRLSAAREWEIVDAHGAAPVDDARALTQASPELAPRPAQRVWHAQGDRVLAHWRQGTVVPGSHFDLHLKAEDWAGWAVPERLISLDSLRGVERFPHQIKACLKAMRELNGRAILADEVGLGKTIEAGIVLKEYLLRGAVRTTLVLVPASLCEQWRAELWEKFELDFVVSRGPAGQWGRHPLVISSLETARHERHRRRVRGANYDLVVVDEAHRLRNHLTLGWKFINDLDPRYLLLLTATPVQNSLEELYNLVTLLQPGQLPTPKEFRPRFLDPKRPRQPREPEELRRLLSQVMIRNTRANAGLDLPPRHAETVRFEPEETEREFWQKWEVELRDQLGRLNASQSSLWGRLLLQTAGSSPAAWRAALRKFPDSDAANRWREQAPLETSWQRKCELMPALTREAGGVVIFTQFLETQSAVAEYLRGAGVQTHVINGMAGQR